ncbi:NAD(P)-binding protein [Lojkania enalia]|uniref:NAD(P)-binding protein n=1 Tax=Lojkania enalia TaxID=147567 RepID=A0A9P4N7X3_9PLEO|nr:NAD(P)-binding protein [Didymosphaeria enalia]
MVKYRDILATNSSFFSTHASSNLTAVFVGATNGIGLGTLRAFAKHTSGASPTIYIVGRSRKSLDSLTQTIAKLNPSAKLIPVEAPDLTLVKDAQSAANQIAEQAEKIDFLFMSPGYLALHYDESPEGLDRLLTIRYYARIRFLLTLAPLLRKSENPKVVSVLGAGTEGKLFPEDWQLKNHYSLPNAAGAASSMMALFLEEFAKRPENEGIGIVYTFPGLVGGTGLRFEGLPWWAKVLVDWVMAPVMRLFGYSIDEVGERTLYGATCEKLVAKEKRDDGAAKGSDGAIGSGVYLLHSDSNVIPGNKMLTQLREQGMGEKVWEHTIEVFGRIEGA